MRSASARVAAKGFSIEDVDAGGEELGGDGGVVDGGDADGGGVEGHGRKRGSSSTEAKAGDVVGGGEGRAALGVGFDESGELERVGAGEFELAIDAKVIAAEGAGADDGDAEGRHGYFLLRRGQRDSTASRQRA